MPPLVPPRLPSRFNRSNAPGAPLRPRGIVVTLLSPKHGQAALPSSFGCVFLTTIGATYFADWISAVRAVAVEPTVTELTPNSFVKMPVAGFLIVTLIVSFGPYDPEQGDRVRVRGRHRHVRAGLPARGDRDVEVALLEVFGRGADGRFGRSARVGGLAGHCGLARAGAGGVGQLDVVVEDDPELDDGEQDQGEDRKNERKLGHRLALLVSNLDSLLHGICHLSRAACDWVGP